MRPAGRFFFGGGMVSASLGEKKWCHVGDIATKKNCDFASGYEQFAGYNTLFHNHDANPIKPNTNYNHKTDLAYATEIIRHHQLNIISKFFGLQHDRCDTEFY